MTLIKNALNSLKNKPLESLVDCAEYVYALHSKAGQKMLFFVTMICSSVLMLFLIADPLNLKNLSVPAVPTPQLFSFSPKSDAQTSYDPLRLLDDIRTNNSEILIVDVRTRADFDAGHIKNAIHIPASKNGAQYPTKDEIAQAVKEIKDLSKGKVVVVYGHFQGTSYVQELAQTLRRKRVSAYALSIGWNEWYHFRNLWLPESIWSSTDMDRFVQIKDQ